MKFFWLDATTGKSWNDRKMAITAALESGASGVVVREEDYQKASSLGKVKFVVENSCEGDMALTGRPSPEKLPQLESSEVYRGARSLARDCPVASYVDIMSKKHETLATKLAEVSSYVVVVGKDWKVIPLENLIAQLQKKEAQIIAGVRDAQEAKLAFETLEVGVDGVLLQSQDPSEIKAVAEIAQSTKEKLELTVGKVKRVEQVGLGDRVCVDSASLLNRGEGMLVGSQGSGLFLVHSETLESEYVSSRPFRVNAGAVHAYILAPGEKTRYLSEVEAGDELLAVDSEGGVREVITGRVKIEKRPLMLVEAEAEGERYKTLLQNAETINLVTPEGKPISVAKVKEGDELLLYVKKMGRHFGMEVEESVIER